MPVLLPSPRRADDDVPPPPLPLCRAYPTRRGTSVVHFVNKLQYLRKTSTELILFERLDVSQTGTLSRADLEAYANLAEQAAAKRSQNRQNLNTQPAANNSSRISDPYLANAA